MPPVNTDNISGQTVAECTAAQVANAINRSFEGYVMPVNVSSQGYERRFRSENLDPFASRVYFHDTRPVAVLLVARRGWTSRIAAMAVAPEVRAKGFGKRILQGAIREASSRGDRSLLLEVFEQNTPAVKLYTGLGFAPLRRLVGYHRELGAVAPNTLDTLSELDPLYFARVVAREGEANLPWMLAAETLPAAVYPARAYHLDHHAYALIDDPDSDTIFLSALVVPRLHRRKGWGTRLVRALYAAFPNQAWSIPAVVPEELAPGFFAQCGWKRQSMSQMEMVLDLTSGEHTTVEAGTRG